MSNEHVIPGELQDTDSYDLTQVPTGESGPEPPNVQWKPPSRTVEETLAQGLSNEDLWMLIRRFNKQIYHVTAVPDATKNLDLNRAEDEQFPPEKLRMTLERFYTSVIVGLTEFFRHVGRLRSWEERGRTLLFCVIYFVSWLLDLLIPTILSVMVALIMFPPIRPFLFPMESPKAESGTSNANDIPAAQPESQDSLTGAPETHKGEAAEQEAKHLIDTVANVAMESAAGKYGMAVTDDSLDKAFEQQQLEETEASAEPQGDDSSEDKTKKPIKSKAARGTDKTMRVLSDITDVYEQFANLLSPTPPFYLITSRLRLAGILTLVSFVVPFAPSYWIIKGVGFALGFGFFGGPVFAFTEDLLNRKIPNWKDHLDIQKTLLEGVPTNAQLTLTLLRIGEINSSPLPPPPNTEEDEPSWPMKRRKSKATTVSTQSTDKDSLMDIQTQASNETLPPPKPKRRLIFKLLKFVRRTIATAIRGHIAFDRAMAIAGSAHTKNLLTMLQKRHFVSTPFGPLKFDAKFERKRGAAVIDSSKQPPILYFTTYQSAGLDDLRVESRKKGSVLFQIPVTDIQELKKTEGLGWKGKLIVELTAGSKEAADGLVVAGKEEGQSFHLTGMRSRNQLFNRLVAVDAQFWESR